MGINNVDRLFDGSPEGIATSAARGATAANAPSGYLVDREVFGSH
jgi:hypothetical protein